MRKKNFENFVFIMLIISIISLPVQAEGTEPSNWAVTEVEQAKANGLTDNLFNQNYQQPIKRYEYVLLALKVLDKKGSSVKIIQKYPFSDILGHACEDDIVRAYNAGLINGYLDGTFKPDKEITREEIATLIFNLAKKLDSDITLPISGINTYADSNFISKWAGKYVDYCYNNGILQGVGKNAAGLDKINPKGNALIEQAIVLLYRFANIKGLLKTYDLGTVQIMSHTDISDLDSAITYSSNNTKTYETSDIINDFAAVFGEKMALDIKELSQKDSINITGMSSTYAALDIQGIGSINIVKNENEIDLNMTTNNLEDDTIFDYFYQLAGDLNDLEQLKIVTERSRDGLKGSTNFTFSEPINQIDYFKSFSQAISLGQEDEVTIQYAFLYQHGLF